MCGTTEKCHGLNRAANSTTTSWSDDGVKTANYVRVGDVSMLPYKPLQSNEGWIDRKPCSSWHDDLVRLLAIVGCIQESDMVE